MMDKNNAVISYDVGESIESLNVMATQVLENLDFDPMAQQDQYLESYGDLLEQVVTSALSHNNQDLVSSCQTVVERVAAMKLGEVEFDETQFMNLSQFPMLLQESIQSEPGATDSIDEFLDSVGWKSVATEHPDVAENSSDFSVSEDEPLIAEDRPFADEQRKSEDRPFADRRQNAKEQPLVDEPLIAEEQAFTDEQLIASEPPLADELPAEGPANDSPGLDRMQQEVVDLLRAELAEIIDGQRELIELLTDAEAVVRIERQELQTEQLERIVNACDMVGLDGISTVVSQISANIADMDVLNGPLDEQAQALVIDWPIAVLRYFQESFSEKSITLLLQLLQRSDWAFPLIDEEAEQVSALLNDVNISIEDADTVPRQTEACPEDLSLEIAADVNRELLESLLEELPEQTAEFSATVQSMIENRFVSDIELARRIAHTVKGSCNIVGIAGLANMTHQLEDILDEMALHKVIPTGKLADMLLDAADCMESMVEALLGLGETPSEALQVQQSILDWANHIDTNGIADITLPAAKPGSSARSSQQASGEHDPEIAEESPESPTEMTAESDAVLRIRSSLVDELLRIAGENIISTGQVHSHLENVRESMLKVEMQNVYLSKLVGELEQLVDVRGVVSKQQRSSSSEMDDLEMERYNELHTSTHRIIEAVIDNIEFVRGVSRNLKSLEDVAEVQENLVRVNQESVLKTRMVPVSTTIPRLQRCVRQAARATDRRVRLEVEGSDTLIDSKVLSDLVEPLMHMLRNSVDHGIESAEQRVTFGKDAEGRIDLNFAREGDHITVTVQDDGRGLDKNAIIVKAEERGMLAQGQVPSDDEIYNLILTPGFSTRAEVTQLSGRGVGMDVVSQKVRSIKGALAISSEEGRGTSMIISLPVTLLSTHAMIIPVDGQMFAVSNFGVEEIIYAEQGDIDNLGEKLVFKADDNILGAHFLNEKLGTSSVDSAITDARVGLMVRRNDGSNSIMLVENIIDSRDLVVKPLLQHIPKVDGIVGATILGDGSVAPVLDLTELLLTKASRGISRTSDDTSIDQTASHLPYALVVDDSYSARSNLEQFVSDLGFEVRSAKDGMEAVEIISERVPDILLTDLEMPRMNGLDLTTHVRANQRTREMPVILITSRSTQKHRDLAEGVGVNEYLTKPYSEDDLSQHIVGLIKS